MNAFVPAVHSVALNVGADFTSQAPLDGRGWTTFRFQHLGMALLPAEAEYSVRHLDAHEIVAVEIEPDFVPAQLRAPEGGVRWRHAVGLKSPVAAHLISALAEDARVGSPGGVLLAESLATALLAHLTKLEPRAPAIVSTPALGSQKLRRVLDHIHGNLESALTLQTLAGLLEMDTFQFGRAFRRCTGLPPHRYVMRARIDQAKLLLRKPGLSVTEIAMAVGFATPSHFALTFRRFERISPRQYRDAL